MTKEEARLAVMGAISMALKNSTLQQGFEIICKENAELEKENAELKKELVEKGQHLDLTEKEWGKDLVQMYYFKTLYTKQTDQLTKAKEIIKYLCGMVQELNKPNVQLTNIDYSLSEAKQFLKETE